MLPKGHDEDDATGADAGGSGTGGGSMVTGLGTDMTTPDNARARWCSLQKFRLD